MFSEWRIPFYQNDINDMSALVRAIIENDVKTVVHFAAETHVDNSIRDAQPFVDNNVKGTLSILEACRRTGVGIVHVSTDEVYGPAKDYPFSEDSRLNPMNPYSATKAAAEHLVVSHANTYGTRYLILRPSNNYGPRQHTEKFIPKYIKSCFSGKKFPLYGDGNQIREWFYVKDNANMIRQLTIKFANGEIGNDVYNVGKMGTSLTNIAVCQLIHKQIGSEVPFLDTISFVDDRPGHDKMYAINTSKVMKLLPEFQFVDSKQALQECIDYYRPLSL
jgi:dTDP-glucose 4,6-dehydratase